MKFDKFLKKNDYPKHDAPEANLKRDNSDVGKNPESAAACDKTANLNEAIAERPVVRSANEKAKTSKEVSSSGKKASVGEAKPSRAGELKAAIVGVAKKAESVVVKKDVAKKADGKETPRVSKVEHRKLELLVTVVNRQKGEFYADLLQSFEVNMQLSVYGKGTASGETLRMLGMADSDKTVIFSIIRQDRIKDALEALNDRFETIKNGKGIAYTVPLSSVIGVAIYGFLSNNRNVVKEGL